MTEEIRHELAALREEVAALREVVDLTAITQLVMTYGPLVDAGAAESTAALWSADGAYIVDGVLEMHGREAITSMISGVNHQSYINGGAGHFLTSPSVKVDGDDAVAYNHAMLIVLRADGYRIERLSANRWTLARKNGRWEITERRNRPLDGNAGARALLGEAAKD